MPVTLRAENPWADVLQAQAPRILERLRFEHPDLDDVSIAAVGQAVWISGPASGDSADVVWRIASAVAEWWPGWLADLGVSLTVTAGDLRVSAPPLAMVALSEGASLAEWSAATAEPPSRL